MCYATFPASAETSLVRSECATALRVQAFNNGCGRMALNVDAEGSNGVV